MLQSRFTIYWIFFFLNVTSIYCIINLLCFLFFIFRCPIPESLDQNMVFDLCDLSPLHEGYAVGTNCSVSCSTGYKSSITTTYCMSFGVWENQDELECMPTCPPLEDVFDQKVITNFNSISYIGFIDSLCRFCFCLLISQVLCNFINAKNYLNLECVMEVQKHLFLTLANWQDTYELNHVLLYLIRIFREYCLVFSYKSKQHKSFFLC